MKVYAIKSGWKKNVIVDSWEKCKLLTHGFKGAKFKGFTSISDAENYLNSKTITPTNKKDLSRILESINVELDHDSIKITVDGLDIEKRIKLSELIEKDLYLDWNQQDLEDYKEEKILLFQSLYKLVANYKLQ